MGLKSILILFILLLSVTLISAETIEFEYTTTGNLSENGDEYWDPNELDILSIKLFRGETLALGLESNGYIELMLCSCSGEDDIEDILYDEVYGYGSTDLYLWIDSYSYNAASYTAQRDITLNIAVFSYDSYNPSSMSYTIYHSIPMVTRNKYSGSVMSNNDTVLHETEYSSFLFEMPSGELDFRVITNFNLGVLVCDCENVTMAQDRLDADTLGADEYQFFTNTTIGWIIPVDSRTDYFVYVYSILGETPGSFDLISTRQEGDTIDDTPQAPSSSGDPSEIPWIGILIFGVITFAVLNSVRKRGRKKHITRTPTSNSFQRYDNSMGYESNSYQQQNSQYQSQTSSPWVSQNSNAINTDESKYYQPGQRLEPGQKVCNMCKRINSGMFCNNCGSKL